MALQLIDNMLNQMDDWEQKSQSIQDCDMSRLHSVADCFAQWIASGKFAGASAAVFHENQLVYTTFNGVEDLQSQKPIDKDTIFRCYSMTKPITSVALMMLFEEGKFKLDDAVSKYIPNFSDMVIYDYDANKDLDPSDMKVGSIKTKNCVQPILISHLLTHTSGLCYCFDATGKMEPVDKVGSNYFDFHNQKELPLCEVIENKLTKIPLCFEPGTRYNYSFSTDVCGRLVEILSGMKLNEFFYRNIFLPLNMRNTAFYIDGPFNKLNKANLATLYQTSYYGKDPRHVSEDEYENCGLVENVKDQNQFNEKDKGVYTSGGGSGGGLLSTLTDYMTFCKMLLNGGKCLENGKQILSAKTLRLMTQNHLPNDISLKEFCTERSFLKYMFPDGCGFGLGFAVSLKHKYFSKGCFWWGGAASTHFWIDPAKKLCVVVMTQNLGVNRLKFDWRTAIQKCVYESIVTR